MSDDERLYFYPSNVSKDLYEALRQDETLTFRVVSYYVFCVPTPTTEANKAERGARLASVMDLLGYDVTQGQIRLKGNEVVLSGWKFMLRSASQSEDTP